MARQILEGEDAHKAALELLKAGLLDSNPVALGDGAFEVSLKPQLSDKLHFAEVDKLLKDLKTKGIGAAVNPARYYKLILIGQNAHEMAEQVWLQGGIFGRKPQDLSLGIALHNRIRVYGLQDHFDSAYEEQFRGALDDIGKTYNPRVSARLPTPVDLAASGQEFPVGAREKSASVRIARRGGTPPNLPKTRGRARSAVS
jgi:hypothetical protein